MNELSEGDGNMLNSFIDDKPLQTDHAATNCRFGCPFFDAGRGDCRAATRMIPGDPHRRRCCLTDDHDDCPFYLCRALRSSHPSGCDRETFSSGDK